MQYVRGNSHFRVRFIAVARSVFGIAWLIPLWAFALNDSPQGFTVQGQLTDSTGSTALTDSNVQMTIGIYDPTGTCLLYEETQTGINLSQTQGLFAIQVGSHVGDPKRVAGMDPGITMSKVFANAGTQIRAAGAHCAAGYTSAAGDIRLLRFTVTAASIGTVTLSPDQTLGSVSQAIVAQTLQGLDPTQFIQTDSTSNLSQVTVETLTNGSDASSLHNHDSLYVKLGSGGSSQNLGSGAFYTSGSLAIGTNSAASGTEVQVTSGSNTTKGVVIQGASGQQANLFEVDNSSGTPLVSIDKVGDLALSSNTTLGLGTYASLRATCAQPGQIWYAAGALQYCDASSTVQTLGISGADQASLLSSSNTFTGANKFTNSAGALSITPYGAAAGNTSELRFSELSANGSTYVGFKAPDSITASKIWVLPSADGTAGQVLKTDGSGNLSWISPSTGSVTSVTATSPLSSSGGATPQISISQSSSTTNGYLSSSDWSTFNGKVGGASNLTTAGTLTQVSGSGVVTQSTGLASSTTSNVANLAITAGSSQNTTPMLQINDDSSNSLFTIVKSGLMSLFNQKAATGVTQLTVQAGAGQGSTALTKWLDNAGTTTLYSINPAGSATNSYDVANKGDVASLMTANLASYLPLAGGTMTGPIAMGTGKITGLGNPTSAQDAATKTYVDSNLATRSLASTAPAGGNVLYWNNGSTQWQPGSVATALGYTPVNKAGDTMTGQLKLNTAVSADSAAQVLVATGADANKGIVVQANSGSQSGNLQEWQSSTGAVLAKVDASGNLTATSLSGSLTSSGYSQSSGNFSIAGTGTFSTGTGAVALNGSTTIAANQSLTMASGTGQFSQTYSGAATAASITGTSTSSGDLLDLTTTSTSAVNNDKALKISISGANSSSSVTRYGVYSNLTSSGSTSTNVAGYFSATGATNNYGLIVGAGNVGIGTAAPAYLLDLNLGNSNAVRLQSGSGNSSGFINTAFSNFIFGNNIYYNGSAYVQELAGTTSYIQLMGGASNGDIRFNTSPSSGTAGGAPSVSTRMIINNAGSVGIGTTTPAGILDVEGGTAAAATNGTSLTLAAQAAGSGNQNGGNITLLPGTKTGTGAYGGVLIGTTTNPGWLMPNSLYVAGSSYIVGGQQIGSGATFTWGTGSTKFTGIGGSSSSDYLTASTNSTERIRIDGSGNVGIGTTTPTAVLQLKAGTATAGSAPLKLTSGTNLTTPEDGAVEYDGTSLYFTDSTATRRTLATTSSVSSTYLPLAGGTMSGALNMGGQTLQGSTGASGNLTLDSTSNATKGNIILNSSGGNVGIGTTAPGAKLDVIGGAAQQLRLSDNTTDATNKLSYLTQRHYTNAQADISLLVGTSSNSATTLRYGGGSGSLNAATELQFYTAANNASLTGTQRMTIDNTGNVGIGTTTPSGTLQVAGGTAAAATNGTSITLAAQAAGSGNQNGGNIALLPGTKTGTGAYGGVLIGTSTNPGWLSGNSLYVAGNIYAGNAIQATNSIAFGSSSVQLIANSVSSSADNFRITTNSTEKMRVDGSGNVGIGTTSPGYKLDVNGDANIASASALRFGGTSVCTSAGCTSSSDERLKENVKPLENSLEKVLQLQGVEYDYKDKTKFTDKHQIGVIAQDVEKVFPEVVVTDTKTTLKSVAYDHLIAPLIEAVKTLYTQKVDKTEIEAFKTAHNREIASIKADNEAKDQKIKKLEQDNDAMKAYLCTKDPTAPFCR